MDPQNQPTVEPLHKVTLVLTPEPSDDLTPMTATLIVGLGAAGLTSIEQQLVGRGIGDAFTVDLTSGCWEAVMAPISVPFKSVWIDGAPQRVTVTIKATQPADPKEVIKEMALSSGGCGCGGGCDCDCGTPE